MGSDKSIITDFGCYVKKRGKKARFARNFQNLTRRKRRCVALRQGVVGVVLGIVLPVALLLPGQAMRYRGEVSLSPEQETWDSTQVLLIKDGDSILRMSIEEYIAGVVLAEMGPSFETEALKAQAVVARTYTLRRAERGGRHERCTVCTDHRCCQAFISPEEYIEQGGAQWEVEKVRSAVRQTDAMVLRYEGKLIDATYFSCSGGRTEDAVAVWGADIPYLQATDSPGEESAAAYSHSVSFTPQELMMALGRQLEGSPETWFSQPVYTNGGGVASLEIGGQAYSGTQLRSLLGLRSTAFAVTVEDGEIVFETRGFGHRVGMSQYGADAMASSGAVCQEILCHYYQNVTYEKYRDK